MLSVLVLSLVLARLFGPDLLRAAVTGQAGPPGRAVTDDDPMAVIQVVQTALAGAAAIGYLSRSVRPGDEFCGWLAIAALFAAAAHLNYAVHPAIYSDRMSLGDIFRLCFYAVLLIASAREIGFYWRTLALALVAEERRRIARDLHDGLSQELACLTRNLNSLQATADQTAVHDLLVSVERAREASRHAIEQVAVPAQATVAAALIQAVGPVAERLARVSAADGRQLTSMPVQWHSLDNRTVTISPSGTATGVAAGETRIFAQVQGQRSPEVPVRVVPPGDTTHPRPAGRGTAARSVTNLTSAVVQLQDYQDNRLAPWLGRVAAWR